VPVHTYGNVCEMDDIISLAESRGIAVIEDAAESFGSSYRGQLAGTFGTMGTFSLHAAKTITTGEGGMVVTHSDAVKERLLLYRSHGMNGHHYWHDVVGHNFRLGNLQAALGCAQLMHINQIVSLRKQMFGTYKKHLSEVPGVVMQRFPPEVNPVPWVVAVKLDPRAYPQGRDKVMADMTAAGIETRPGFYSPGRMRHLYQYSPLSVADDVSEWTLALPSFPSLTEEQIHTICSELKKNRH
jgi:perosamine synthetase